MDETKYLKKKLANMELELEKVKAIANSQANMEELRNFRNMVDSQADYKNTSPKAGRVPRDWGVCMLTLNPIEEPVRAGDGNVYERWAIARYLAENNHRSPLTTCPISPELTPLDDEPQYGAPQVARVQQPQPLRPEEAPGSRAGVVLDRSALQRMLSEEAQNPQEQVGEQFSQLHLGGSQRVPPSGARPLREQRSERAAPQSTMRWGALGSEFEASVLSTAVADPTLYHRVSNTPGFGLYASEEAKQEEKRRSMGLMSMLHGLFGAPPAPDTHGPRAPGPISQLRNLFMPPVAEHGAGGAEEEARGPGPVTQMGQWLDGLVGGCRSELGHDSLPRRTHAPHHAPHHAPPPDPRAPAQYHQHAEHVQGHVQGHVREAVYGAPQAPSAASSACSCASHVRAAPAVYGAPQAQQQYEGGGERRAQYEGRGERVQYGAPQARSVLF